ncbi:MAG: cupin-like domain-containing protein, partial [Nonlabens ulvanivorans]
MQQLNLKDIPRVRTMSKEDFVKNHLKPQRPVVIEKLTEDWPAYQKWNLEYIKEVAGDKTVPLYDDRPVKHD